MSKGNRIVSYDDRAIDDRYLAKSFEEEASFRERMKALEEYAVSGAVTKPRAEIAGQRVRVAHRMGNRFDVQVQDPFTKQMKTVVAHQYDLKGNRTATATAWTPGNPQSVAAVFGIPFVSAFGDPPKPRPQDESDNEAVAKARRDAFLALRVKDAKSAGEDDYVWRTYGLSKESDVPVQYLERWKKMKKRRDGK